MEAMYKRARVYIKFKLTLERFFVYISLYYINFK